MPGLSLPCSQSCSLGLVRWMKEAAHLPLQPVNEFTRPHGDALVLPVNSRRAATHLGRCAGLRQPISPIGRGHAVENLAAGSSISLGTVRSTRCGD